MRKKGERRQTATVQMTEAVNEFQINDNDAFQFINPNIGICWRVADVKMYSTK